MYKDCLRVLACVYRVCYINRIQASHNRVSIVCRLLFNGMVSHSSALAFSLVFHGSLCGSHILSCRRWKKKHVHHQTLTAHFYPVQKANNLICCFFHWQKLLLIFPFERNILFFLILKKLIGANRCKMCAVPIENYGWLILSRVITSAWAESSVFG